MKNKKNFNEIVNFAMTGQSNVLRPVVEKEILHYEIFSVLYRHRLLSKLIFQGGTSLRLCRGSNRFSEDLDFAGGHNFSESHRDQLTDALKQDIGDKFDLRVWVKEPKKKKINNDRPGINVDKWQISIETHPDRRDIPRQKIKLEIADVPARTKELMPINVNYNGLQNYQGMMVYAETIHEILADKLLSLPMSISYIRHRDIWDIAWLIQQGASFDSNLLQYKLDDYRITRDEYTKRVNNRIQSLNDIIYGKDFHDQLTRFIAPQTQENTINRPGFLDYLMKTTTHALEQAVHSLSNSEDDDMLFRM